MDWQHLIMNGENLAEYAAMLAAEGLLGHQHANSGWGTFDDDNMVGATAFMETLELAIELRRAGYGENGERLGFDLYPYTEDAVAAVRRSVLQWRFIDGVAARIDDAALREAQKREGRRRRLRARLRGARRVDGARSSASTSARPASRRSRSRRTARCSRAPRRSTRSRRRTRAGPSRTPRTGGARREAALAGLGVDAAPDRALGPDARPRRASTTTIACCGRRSSGTTSGRRRSAPRSRSASGSSG